MKSGRVSGGEINLNYIEAECFIPLTVENDIVTEAAFSSSGLVKGKKSTTLVIFTRENGIYTAETAVFDELGNRNEEKSMVLRLGECKAVCGPSNAK